MKVVNPSTGALIAEVSDTTPGEVAAAFDTARVAQPAWAARPLAERIEVLRKFRAGVHYRQDELAATLTAETGKPISQSHS